MLLVSFHQLIEESLTLAKQRRSLFGPTLVISDKLSPSRFMDQINKYLLKVSLKLQSTKFPSLLTSNLQTHINGSLQVKMILMDVVKYKLGNFHSDSTVKMLQLPLKSSPPT